MTSDSGPSNTEGSNTEVLDQMPLPIGLSNWPLFTAFRDAFKLWLPVVELRWWILVLIQFIDYLSKYIFYLSSQQFGWVSFENPISIITANLLQTIIHLFVINAWTLVVIATAEDIVCKRSPRDWEALVNKYFNQMIIENIRYLAAILWRFPLLVFPALWAYVKNCFFNVIVVADANYDKGKVDALKRSQKLTKGRFFMTALILILITVLPGFLEEQLQPDGPDLIKSPIWVFASQISFFIAQTFLLLYFYGVYLNLSKRLDGRRAFGVQPLHKDFDRRQNTY